MESTKPPNPVQKTRVQQPDARRKRYQNTQSVGVIGRARVDMHPKQHSDDQGQDDDFATALDVERHVAQSAPLHGVGAIVLVSRDLAILKSGGFVSQLAGVASQTGERGRPEGQSGLVCWIRVFVRIKFT